jgi:putative exonuclease|nr:MAG TPA: STRUCTURAL MAINTENANCE OF CHROMOSOMES PROTEIN [Caudoviricetes sp.]
MNSIKFNCVKLNNFLSYKEAELRLDRNGFILVNGENKNPTDNSLSNGCGKSSLFNAIAWCLTGRTTSGIKDVSNIYLNETTSVEVDFNINDTKYKVVRTKNPSNVKIYINGEDKSGKGIRDGEQLLAEYIPSLTSTLINSVIILGQGLPQRFTANTPAGRKETLEKLSNSDFMIAEIKDRIAKRKTYLNTEIRNIEDNKLKLETELNLNNQSIEKTEEDINNLLAENIKDKEIKLEEEQYNLGQKKLERDRLSEKLTEEEDEVGQIEYNHSELLSNNLDKVDEFKSKLTNTDELLNEVNELNSEIKVKEQELEKLKNIKDTCPTCGQKLPDVHVVDTTSLEQEIGELTHIFDVKRAELDRINEEKHELINNFKEQLSIEVKEHEELLNKAKFSLVNKRNTLKSIEREVQDLEISVNTIKLEIDNYENKLNSLKKELDNLKVSVNNSKEEYQRLDVELINKQEHLAVINKMESLVKRDFRTFLLSNVIEYLNNKCQEYSQVVFNTTELVISQDKNNISIKYAGKEYETLSGGEKQKVDVIIQLAIRDMLRTYLDFSSNILVLDEITDSLDIVGASQLLNLITTKVTDVEAIYIISHHTDFEIPIDDEILIVKESDSFSRIKH